MRQLANQRTEIHRGQASQRILSPDHDLVGLSGEVEFERIYGYRMDRQIKIAGDNRIDFYTPLATVDVKTYRKPYNLLREEGKPHAEIIVLAGYDKESETAELLGWDWDLNMIECPVKDFGYGVINHYKNRRQLYTMRVFTHLLKWAERLGL